MTFHERYGDVSIAQLRAYKRFNVSQSDHDQIVSVFGEADHAGIAAYVANNANENGGMFSVYSMLRDYRGR